MPLFIGKDQKKKDLINNLEDTYKRIQKDFNVPAGKIILNSHFVSHNWSLQEIFLKLPEWRKFWQRVLDVVDDMMKYDIPQLMKKLPQEQNSFKSEKTESD